MARLFFALWPDPAAMAQLGLLAEALAPLAGGRPVPAAKIHLTLAFLGELDDDRAHAAVATRVHGAPFEVKLDHVGAFRRAKVAWAGISEPAPGLLALQARLEADLRGRGFSLEARPFRPHVTLVRKVAGSVPHASVPAIAWRASSFALVQTRPGDGSYRTVREWELRG